MIRLDRGCHWTPYRTFGRVVGRHVPAVDGEELKQLAIEPQKLQRRSLLGASEGGHGGLGVLQKSLD